MRLGVSQTAMNAKREVEAILKHGKTKTSALHAAMDEGFGWVVVYPQYYGIDPQSKANLEQCLGLPYQQSDELWVFALDRTFPADCVQPE